MMPSEEQHRAGLITTPADILIPMTGECPHSPRNVYVVLIYKENNRIRLSSC